jgi:hypothetical protein
MAGALTVDTLNSSTGVLATQNGMSGVAKAWVNFNGNPTIAIRSSFNVSSMTRNALGDYTVNFTTALTNANYSCVTSCTQASTAIDLPGFFLGVKVTGNMNSTPSNQTTTSVTLAAKYVSASSQGDADVGAGYVVIFSS